MVFQLDATFRSKSSTSNSVVNVRLLLLRSWFEEPLGTSSYATRVCPLLLLQTAVTRGSRAPGTSCPADCESNANASTAPFTLLSDEGSYSSLVLMKSSAKEIFCCSSD